MYEIHPRIAVHGFDFYYDENGLRETPYFKHYDFDNFGTVKDRRNLQTYFPYIIEEKYYKIQRTKKFIIIDCRDISDSEEIKSPIRLYVEKILQGKLLLDLGYDVVCCCSAGQSRSNAIALALLMDGLRYKYRYYDALDLIKQKNPTSNIAQHHLDAIRKIYNIDLYEELRS